MGWGGGSSKEEPSCWRLGPAVPLAQVAQAKDRTSLQLLGYGRLHPNAEPLGRKRTPPPCPVCIESLSPSTARNTFRKGRVEGLVVMGGWGGGSATASQQHSRPQRIGGPSLGAAWPDLVSPVGSKEIVRMGQRGLAAQGVPCRSDWAIASTSSSCA